MGENARVGRGDIGVKPQRNTANWNRLPLRFAGT